MTFPLQARIRRKSLTRSELQGLLGVIPKASEQKQDRYKLSYLSRPEFFQALEDVQEHKESNKLIVRCSEQEIEQFNLEKLKEICVM